jgi:hypothetical protein
MRFSDPETRLNRNRSGEVLVIMDEYLWYGQGIGDAGVKAET